MSPSVAPEAEFRCGRVLVVEDSTTVRRYYRSVLEPLGLEIVEAVNGVEALEKSTDRAWTFALVDVNMPKLDGLSFVRELRTRGGLADTPVLMVSTDTQPGCRRRAYEAGASLYLNKPVARATLEALAAVLAGGADARA